MLRPALLSVVIMFAGCKYIGFEEELGDNDSEIDELPRTLQSVQDEIFTPYCAGSGCHGGDSPALGLRLDSEQNSYNFTVGRSRTSRQREGFRLISPGFPDDSYLVVKVEGGPDLRQDLMPKNRAPLSTARIRLLRDWIANGAPRFGEGSQAARVSAVRADATATGTTTFNVHFSKPVDRSSIDRETLLVYVKVEGEYQLLDYRQYNLAFVDAQTIDVDVEIPDLDVEAIRLRVNDESIAAVMDENGSLLDGDNNNNTLGGVFEYDYVLD